MQEIQWATSIFKYEPGVNELYQPPIPGYSIKPFRKGSERFIAKRGRGRSGYIKNKMFYSVEEARAWLDSLPAAPVVEKPVGREWTKDYEIQSGRYVKKGE
jgi:hypothetical protein